MGTDAKRYLQEHSIPQLFEGLITALIYNKPNDPINFIENALCRLRENSTTQITWDFFIDKEILDKDSKDAIVKEKEGGKKNDKDLGERGEQTQLESNSRIPSNAKMTTRGKSAALKHIDASKIPDVPIILFMGGPGGGKTRHAARVRDALSDSGLVHICMPDLIREAILKYKDRYPEWKEAAEMYQKGELIPNDLALDLAKAEMLRNSRAKAYFLEGFPREARQVEDFEREVRPVNMALILDYDEATLRKHMENRGLGVEMIDARIREFKQKTLPSAKYFDDQRLLHLIPGEEDDQWIFERMKNFVLKAMESGLPVMNSRSPTPKDERKTPKTATTAAIAAASAATVTASIDHRQSTSKSNQTASRRSTPDCAPSQATNTRNSPHSDANASGRTVNNTTSARNILIKNSSTRGSLNHSSRTPSTKSEWNSDKERSSGNKARKVRSRNSSNSMTIRHTSQAQRLFSPPPIRDSFVSVPSTTVSPPVRSIRTQSTLPQYTQPVALPVSAKEINESVKQYTAASETVVRASPQDAKLLPSRTPSTASSGKQKSSSVQDEKSNMNGDLRRLSTSTKSNRSATEEVELFDGHKSVHASQSSSNASTPVPATGIGAQVVRTTASGNQLDKASKYELFPNSLPSETHVILIIGAPGSEKTVITRRLINRFENFVHLSVSNLLTKKVSENTDDELWRRIGKKIHNGNPIPTKICRELLYEAIQKNVSKAGGFIIEGYPKSLNQMIDFEAQYNKLDIAILIDCTEQFCYENVQKHLNNDPNLILTRPDYKADIMKVRLEYFKKNTLPMLKHLDDKGKLKVIRVKKIENSDDLNKIFSQVVSVADNAISHQSRKE